MNTNTKWISTEYRNIQFHVDVITFEIATKKSNIKSISSLLENYTKLVQKGFINTSFVFALISYVLGIIVGRNWNKYVKE